MDDSVSDTWAQAPIRDMTPARWPLHDDLRKRVDEPSAHWKVSALRRKLLWLSWLRILSLLVLVSATAIFSGSSGLSLFDLVQDIMLWVGMIFLVPAALYFPVLLTVKGHRALQITAVIQMAQDALLSGALVLATGGTGSAFTFFFSLNIIVGGIVLGRPGTVLTILGSMGMMVCIAAIELGHIGLPWFLADILPAGMLKAVLYSIGLNGVAFVSIGVLSSYLSEQLRRSDLQSERYRSSLEDLRQLHESILASVGTGIVTCRLDDRILHVNRAAEGMLGIDMNRSKGRSLFEMLPILQEPMRTGPGPFEIDRVGPDGEPLSFKVSVTPLVARTGEKMGRILDVTDTTTVKSLEARMKADERLATIGKLSAVVAHEIRNPLAAISASAQMLSMTSGLEGDDRRALDIVVREGDRLNQWITELLDYARPKKGENVRLDLSELLGQVAEIMRGDPAAAFMEISADIEPGLRIVCEPQRLHRMFLNLAKNSVEAMSEGGQLVIRARSANEAGHPWVVVRIIDNGCGISQEDQARIFEAFYTTKTRGTGLGLATVSQVVEEIGGRISVSSVPYVRTEFEVRLPA
jgi:two-component system sensor histidine kinase PilS (NtrC family)